MSAWGYTACGRARVFEDGVLPEGWHAKPQVKMTADEVTARAHAEVVEGRPVSVKGFYLSDPVVGVEIINPVIVNIDAPASVPKRRGRPPKVKPDGENAG